MPFSKLAWDVWSQVHPGQDGIQSPSFRKDAEQDVSIAPMPDFGIPKKPCLSATGSEGPTFDAYLYPSLAEKIELRPSREIGKWRNE